ncbi:MAG: type IV secretion system protein VirB10 [Steroidobacteraceae bacterium]
MSAPKDPREEGDPEETRAAPIAGERAEAAVHRIRSVQSRVSSLLAMTLMIVLGGGLLAWYYAHMIAGHARAAKLAQQAVKARATGYAPLPSPGQFAPPVVVPAPKTTAVAASAPPLLGPPPRIPAQLLAAATVSPQAVTNPFGYRASDPNPPKSPRELALERRLAGPAFAGASGPGSAAPVAASYAEPAGPMPTTAGPRPVPAGESGAPRSIAALLTPTLTPAVRASVLPTRRFLLAKGTFIDCTLETAIDSTLPGMTTCITATDTFGVDGQVVLLERGTKLVGETRGDVTPGGSRVFVLWTEARTPTGVVVPLASPGTDALGRSGLTGIVNRHFWERFGAAMLVSVIDGGVQAAALSNERSSNAVIVSPTTSSNVVEDVLRSTINIPPTVTVAQGTRVEVLVARDLDFRSVYALQTVAHGR